MSKVSVPTYAPELAGFLEWLHEELDYSAKDLVYVAQKPQNWGSEYGEYLTFLADQRNAERGNSARA